MKISNFKDVKRVINVLENIESIEEQGPDSGGVKGIAEYGYKCSLGIYSDGSGPNVDMTGCYVAREVAVASMNVLRDKRKEVIEWLEEHGVETEE